MSAPGPDGSRRNSGEWPNAGTELQISGRWGPSGDAERDSGNLAPRKDTDAQRAATRSEQCRGTRAADGAGCRQHAEPNKHNARRTGSIRATIPPYDVRIGALYSGFVLAAP